jgi:Uncharacterized protein conserved in bacteria
MGHITPFLWFDTEAEEAAKFYVSVFPNSKITGTTRYPPGVPPHAPRDGQVMTVEFELDGNPFVALNGGPEPKFNHSVSFTVPCRTQQEIDAYWSSLAGNGGQELACGWLTDRYGLAWQIVPDFVAEIPRSEAAMKVMMTMTKFDIAALRQALGKS